jgi:hypothetical protein
MAGGNVDLAHITADGRVVVSGDDMARIQSALG